MAIFAALVLAQALSVAVAPVAVPAANAPGAVAAATASVEILRAGRADVSAAKDSLYRVIRREGGIVMVEFN